MNVLSLFDGMSCGQIALNRIGIKPDNYYAAEIDGYAIAVTQGNYPETTQLGDVTKWREWSVDWSSIGLILGGSPCQGFSFAGKQLAFDDPRSSLFFEYVNILKHVQKHNPDVKFLLENVKMKVQYLDVISELLGVKPVLINSALVSAQNRQRYYWANWEFDLPEDKGVGLSEIIEGGVVDRNKSFCIDANYFKGGNLKSYFEKSRRQLIFQRGRGNNPGGFRALNEKTPAMTANSWQHNNFLADITGFRKLTPIECERLQTVPDNYTGHVSNTQRYRMLGNGWTVDVIAHILRYTCTHLEEYQNNSKIPENL